MAAQLQNNSTKPPGQLPNGSGTPEAIPLHESESVMTISKLADADNNNTPLKGETPPTGRRAQAGQLLRRMTKMSKVRGLKDEGKDWIKGRMKGRAHKGDRDTSSSSDSENEDKKKRGDKDETDNHGKTDEITNTPKSSKVVK